VGSTPHSRGTAQVRDRSSTIDRGQISSPPAEASVPNLANLLDQSHGADGLHGRYPIQHLFQATNGAFYGVTDSDGSSGDGTIFRLSVGLGPFVETAPTSGKVGTNLIILGNKLKGAIKVSFNGTAAVFKVVSATEIATTVPSGATTGPVEVTTPSGTLTSNVNFLVKK